MNNKEEFIMVNSFNDKSDDIGYLIENDEVKNKCDDYQFVEAVTKLFTKCTNTGTLPSVWKSASVVALFKSGAKAEPLNYRPVSLTCIVCKVYEQLLRTHIVSFLEHRISKHQHGFIKGTVIGTKRVVSCHPIKFLGGGEGLDPVKKKRN